MREGTCGPTCVLSEPGTYALILLSSAERLIRVGKLGCLRIQSGFYVYVGSALGPGGVGARLAHHLRPAQRPHWHIDYLRKHTTVEDVWFRYDVQPLEDAWARAFAEMVGVSMPLAGFGASDCTCNSHLFFCKRHPRRGEFLEKLQLSEQPVFHLGSKKLTRLQTAGR